MSLTAWALLFYLGFDRLLTFYLAGRRASLEFTPAAAVFSLFTGALIAWAIIDLATN